MTVIVEPKGRGIEKRAASAARKDLSILVLGAGGQVGRAVIERAGGQAVGLDRAGVDIRDERSVLDALTTHDFDAVINCAAYTAVDRAESESDLAFAVNARGAGNVARAAAGLNLPVLHMSTDYVYSDQSRESHLESEAVAPLNVYGASKAAGDAAVIGANPAHLILRVSWVFGQHGSNFVRTMLRLAREHPELRIVADQTGGPTEACDIADALIVMARAAVADDFGEWGIYHFQGAPATTWHEFARAIFERSRGPAPTLLPITTADYPTPAKRPLNSRFDCEKIHRTFGIAQPDWKNSLSRVIAALEEHKP